ncbi:MAG: SDR family oxidoreductase [Isosphaerales bacterium]
MEPSTTLSTGDLRGKVVLITGGRRVGGELALMLAARGTHVAMTFHTSRAVIERTIESARALGVAGLAVAADLSRPTQAENAVNEVAGRFGRLDALVSMASVYRRTPLADLSPRDFDDMIAANLAAPYHTALAAARLMLAQPGEDGIKGKIVVMGDWATERPYKDYLPYLVAKGGLTTMTLALARELAPHIPVAMIQPAMIEPPADLTADEKQAVLAQTPLQRFGLPADVNRLILYLLEGTNFVTGACFRVDGGRFLGVG